jgi:hypothetical protein
MSLGLLHQVGKNMKKIVTSIVVFASTSLASVIGASAADYPVSGGGVTETVSTGVSALPETGASIFSNSFMFGNTALLLGLGIAGTIALRRRSVQN